MIENKSDIKKSHCHCLKGQDIYIIFRKRKYKAHLLYRSFKKIGVINYMSLVVLAI